MKSEDFLDNVISQLWNAFNCEGQLEAHINAHRHFKYGSSRDFHNVKSKFKEI